MTNYYTLRFSDELNAMNVADRLGYLDDDGELISLGHAGAIQEIGVVFVPGTYDANGNELVPAVQLSGFFVNIAADHLPSGLAKYQVPYGSGGNIFAGTKMDKGAWPPVK